MNKDKEPLGYCIQYEKRKRREDESIAGMFWKDYFKIESAMIKHEIPFYTQEEYLKIKKAS